MVEIKITGFGYTWVDSDHPLAVILGTCAGLLLFTVVVLRFLAPFFPEQAEQPPLEEKS